MPRKVTIAAKILFSLVAAFLIVVLLGFIYLSTPYFSATVGTWLTHRSGRNVVLEGNIETHLWSREPRIILSQVKIGNAEWGSSPTMFEAQRIEFSLEPLELLRGRLVMPELLIDQPLVLLEKNEKGDANWHFMQNPQASALKQPLPKSRSHIPIISHLKITDGQLTYRDPVENILTQVGISTVSGESGKEEAIHVTGKGTYQKQPFSLDITGASVLQLRESATPYPFSLKTTIGSTSAQVEGTVQDPIRLEAFDVILNLKGTSAADLFPITGIALPPTPPYLVSGRLSHQRKGEHWHFEKFAGHMGGSDLKGDVTWHPDQSPPYFEGNFTSDNLDMADLAGFIGAHRKPADESRIIPDTQLDISRLLAMNADVTFHGNHVKEPDILEDFYMKANLKDGVLHLRPLSFGIAGGKIDADVTIEGLKTPPVATMQIDFQKLSLNDLFTPLAEHYGKENVSAGLLGGKASLTGHGKSLRDILATSNGDIAMAMEGGQLSRLLLDLIGLDLFRAAGLILTDSDEPVPLHCVVAHFTVASGMMEAQEFLIDTDVTSIRAEGGVNLHDETIAMHLHTSPKEPSPFSMHSPIEINGTLKNPHIGVNKAALVARGGIAAALVVAAPPAAWLAFIEPGLGKGSNCAAFIGRFKDTGVTVPHSGQ